MKLGMIITQTEPETVFNALRLALFSLQQGDTVRIFLSGKGVDLDKIEDPVWIYPGMTLVIPRDLPSEHRVAPYETLEIIAGYWEVYGDPAQWTRLFEANKDKVKDPYDLEPGIVLVIPR